VLFDAYPHTYGGAQRVDHLVASRLPEHGWDVEVIVPGPGPFVDELVADGITATVIRAPSALNQYGRTTTGRRAVAAVLRLPGWWLRLGRELRRRRPTVVNVIDHRGLLLAAVPARLIGARVVWHVHSINGSRALNRVGARLAHEVVVPTLAIVRQMPDLRRARSLQAITNAVRPEVRRPQPVALASEPLITTSARLHPDKGLDVLIAALATLRRAVPGARAVVVGPVQDGFEDVPEQLSSLARERGVDDAFELAGYLDQPERVVERSRCYVQPARERTEVLPLAILEAMAMGVPVVATDVGGVRDIVVDGETGLLVPPEDADQLAAALERVLTDDALARSLRDAAFALVSEPRFTPEGFVASMASAYDGRR